jgi:hypothetical protein
LAQWLAITSLPSNTNAFFSWRSITQASPLAPEIANMHGIAIGVSRSTSTASSKVLQVSNTRRSR